MGFRIVLGAVAVFFLAPAAGAAAQEGGWDECVQCETIEVGGGYAHELDLESFGEWLCDGAGVEPCHLLQWGGTCAGTHNDHNNYCSLTQEALLQLEQAVDGEVPLDLVLASHRSAYVLQSQILEVAVIMCDGTTERIAISQNVLDDFVAFDAIDEGQDDNEWF